jgi:hypothetical protein
MTPRLSPRRVPRTCCQTGCPAAAASQIPRRPTNKLPLRDWISVVTLSYMNTEALEVAIYGFDVRALLQLLAAPHCPAFLI